MTDQYHYKKLQDILSLLYGCTGIALIICVILYLIGMVLGIISVIMHPLGQYDKNNVWSIFSWLLIDISIIFGCIFLVSLLVIYYQLILKQIIL